MEKIKELVSQIQWFKVLFVLSIIRVLVDQKFDISHSLVVVSLIGLYGYKAFLDSKKSKDINEDIRRELTEMKNTLSSVSIKAGIKTKTEAQRFF